jgi:hypothetical protein
LNSELKIQDSKLGILASLVFGFIVCGCNHGLEPPTVQPGFSGTIHFVSPWPHPPVDSVYDIRVVAFPNYPDQNIISAVLYGGALVYPAIGAPAFPLFADSLSYSFSLEAASTFQYLVVAMQYGPNTFSDWKVVGAYGYSKGVGAPKTVVVPPNTFVNGINIDVDFENVPPTPGGNVVAAACSGGGSRGR